MGDRHTHGSAASAEEPRKIGQGVTHVSALALRRPMMCSGASDYLTDRAILPPRAQGSRN